MKNPKFRKILSTVIVVILVLSMIVPIVLGVMGY